MGVFSVELRKPVRKNEQIGPVEIYLDEEELQNLVDDLLVLKRSGGKQSPFYATESWCAGHLDETQHRPDNVTVHLLKFFLTPG